MDKWLSSVKRPCAQNNGPPSSSQELNCAVIQDDVKNSLPSSSTSEPDCAVIQEDKIPTKIRKITRKYDPECINIGFTVTDVNNEPPQCVICFEILSNQRMKPSLLNRHFNTNHSTLISKQTEGFFHPKINRNEKH
ncbi:zinc finger MYM-type protein 6-like [Diabrotica undecimpunctata]|uniref:zinc finger MYM-type protein 6-like n=1 Tax=Diabrotica undecimpunctata TaxID=50387 RepID=UPI003B63DFA7